MYFFIRGAVISSAGFIHYKRWVVMVDTSSFIVAMPLIHLTNKSKRKENTVDWS